MLKNCIAKNRKLLSNRYHRGISDAIGECVNTHQHVNVEEDV